MRSRRWTGSSETVVERRSSTVGGSLRTAILRPGESSIGFGGDAALRERVPLPTDRRCVAARARELGPAARPRGTALPAAYFDLIARPMTPGLNCRASAVTTDRSEESLCPAEHEVSIKRPMTAPLTGSKHRM